MIAVSHALAVYYLHHGMYIHTFGRQVYLTLYKYVDHIRRLEKGSLFGQPQYQTS